MIEDSIGTAIKGFTDASPVLGGVIILLLLAVVWLHRFHLGVEKELKAELIAERVAHQKTREAQLEDIRNLGHVAVSVDALRVTIERQDTTIRDVLVRRAV